MTMTDRTAIMNDGRIEPLRPPSDLYDGPATVLVPRFPGNSHLLKRAAIGGAAITVPGILAACGSSGTKASGGTTSVEQKLASTLHFSNWTLYIDTNNKTHAHPSLDQFQKKTGTHVDYVEDIN